MTRFQDKVAIVTGAGRGIGRQVAIKLAREGAAVCVNYSRSQELAEAVVADIEAQSGRAFPYIADVRRSDQVQAMVDETVRRYGHVDIVVANAGVADRGAFLEIDEAQWDKVIDTNLKGAFLVCQRGAREMVKTGRGKIVVIGSVAGNLCYPGMAAYSTAKGAEMALTRAMAADLALHNVNVNCLVVGRTVREWELEEGSSFDPHSFDEIMPLGRLGQTTEIADAVAFLCSSEADFITGAALPIDGGLSVMNYLWGCAKGPVRKQH